MLRYAGTRIRIEKQRQVLHIIRKSIILKARASPINALPGCLDDLAALVHDIKIVAIAAGEAKNPRRNLPKAIRRVYIRILLFYIGGVSIIGLLVPSSDPSLNLKAKDAGQSPFVIAIRHAGIKGLPSVCFFLCYWEAKRKFNAHICTGDQRCSPHFRLVCCV